MGRIRAPAGLLLALLAASAAAGNPGSPGFDAALLRVLSGYIGKEISPPDAVVTVERDDDSAWVGTVEVYKEGAFEIVIDHAGGTVFILTEEGPVAVLRDGTGAAASDKMWICSASGEP